MQVAGLCSPEAREFAGDSLKARMRSSGSPASAQLWNLHDTGRLADFLGAISGAMGGIPVPDLPVAAAAPEYMEQKATIDAIFALALGLYTYVNPVPTVTGAPNLVKLLTKDCREVTGGILNVEKDALKAVDGIEQHIMEKRQKVGF